MPFWSVVQTESRREHIAAKFLERDFKIYFPKIAINSGARERIAPLFPNYLFVEIIDQWWSVRWTVGVVKLLMADEKPARMPDENLDLIRRREIGGLVQLPHSKMRQTSRTMVNGDAVRVMRGSFEGRIGVYQGQSGSQRSHILLNLLGREVRVVVGTAAIALASQAS